jgi:protocatechuate 3,4-dioxygenase beta subunit
VNATDYDFSENVPASIRGRVYAEPGDVSLEGVTIQLTDASGTVVTTTTGTGGEYSFTNLKPGTYKVYEVQPDGYVDSTDYVGTAGGTLSGTDAIVDIALTAGVDGTDYDFSENSYAQLSGYVYLDADNDGQRDSDESPLAGVTLALLDAAGNATGATTVTDGNGAYAFTNLTPGTYGVAETQPMEYNDGLDSAGTAGGSAENPGDQISGAVLSAGVNAQEYNFGELQPASIGGRVHAELDQDCELDSNEWPISGVTVYLVDTSGNHLAETTTDSDGYYQFTDLNPGLYAVEEVQPDGYLNGDSHLGTAGGWIDSDDRISSISLEGGVDATGYDFCELVPATLSGYVYQDGPVYRYNPSNGVPDVSTLSDGKFDSSDAPIAGVTLTLCNAEGAPLTDSKGNKIQAVTNSSGYYEFSGLEPGVYTVLEDQPNGYVDGLDTVGTLGGVAINGDAEVDTSGLNEAVRNDTSDAIIRISLGSGDEATNYNFSEVKLEAKRFWIPNSNIDPLPPLSQPQTLLPPQVVGAIYYAVPDVAPQLIFLGGASPVASHTWHLSVINGGQPRRMQDGMELSRTQTHTYFNVASWSGMDLRQGEWVIANVKGKVIRKLNFGIRGGIPVAGDWNGDGTAEPGVYLVGEWFLDLNGDGLWDQGDLWAQLGHDEDQPVSGDWDGDGKTDIGIFGPAWAGDPKAIAAEPGQPDPQNLPSPTNRFKNIPPSVDDATSGYRAMKHTARGKLRADLIDHVFHYGTGGDRAVTGDWNGDGVYTIGVFRDGIFYLDVDGDGKWSLGDATVKFGQAGDLPLAGDWNGDGKTELGVFRNGVVILDVNGDRQIDSRDSEFRLGKQGDLPVSGDFDGDGIDDVAVYHEAPPQGASPQAAEQRDAASDEVAARPAAAVK